MLFLSLKFGVSRRYSLKFGGRLTDRPTGQTDSLKELIPHSLMLQSSAHITRDMFITKSPGSARVFQTRCPSCVPHILTAGPTVRGGGDGSGEDWNFLAHLL